ncbi:Di-copper centre-containing protein [Durotheca rogersii]|uniref:Di-copper centre-containing protein n=1 Tax=Durotheca rogersii TaxID=419775 RepID=UPI0022212882|nr:Di-copper centre-containing protein [Durotheca rogersii]KAI5865367.1 Di-copper centre-containing protein [Durotheca rogersii]
MASTEGFYPIIGIQDGLDPDQHQLLREVPVRMEIDDWFTSDKLIHVNQRALFFPAIWKFSQTDPHEKLSWFQIAGIHGKPFVPWDEPGAKPAVEDEGYCTHNSVLFSTWHRPYLLLFEQVIFELMKEVVGEYPEEARPDLIEAARTWRLPYWDWGLKKPIDGNPRKRDYTVPSAVLQETVEIRLPTAAGYGSVQNALYQFTMPGRITMGDPSLEGRDLDLRITASEISDGDQTYIFPFDKCQATSRHPKGTGVTQDWIAGKQDNDAIVQELRDYRWDSGSKTEGTRNGNMTAGLRAAFYRILTIETFDDFVTKRAPNHGADNPITKDHAYDSCEGLHDNIHDWCGGDWTEPDNNNIRLSGHMGHVPVAAFDPIFWIHHCNVDRATAIWQVLHDNSWFDGSDPRDEDLGTFSIPFRHKDKPTDPLRPFHKGDGAYWTSSDVREPTALGYTYPGLERWRYTTNGVYDKQKHLRALKKTLNANYNGDWSAAQKSRLTADPGQLDGPRLASLRDLPGTPDDLITHDYVVNVIYEKFALNGNKFTIHIFIGKVPEAPPYGPQAALVGQVSNFSTEPGGIGASRAGCANCRAQQADRSESTGRVVLTNALITRWKNQIVHEGGRAGPAVLGGMTPDHVVAFLRAHLDWRVTSLGAPVDLPSLRVSVAVGRADHYADRTKMSRYHSYRAAYEVTQGRPGGACPEDCLYPPDLAYSLPTQA